MYLPPLDLSSSTPLLRTFLARSDNGVHVVPLLQANPQATTEPIASSPHIHLDCKLEGSDFICISGATVAMTDGATPTR